MSCNERYIRAATLAVSFVTLVLTVLVAVGNWHLYDRVARLEATLESQAMQQLLQRPWPQTQPKTPR
jgi:hypothetical protein